MEGSVEVLNIGRPKHKYGWIAHFKDGSTLRQFERGKEHHMGDVYNCGSPLESFVLQRRGIARLNGHQIVVHLDSGIIEINGMKLLPYDGKEPIMHANFRIEFWMRTYSTIKMVGKEQEGGPINRVKYFVGWSVEYNGKKIERLVNIGFNDELGMG